MASTEEQNIRNTKLPLWARIPGFPFWPARLCSSAEEADFLTKKAKNQKATSIPVVFLGSKQERAWIGENSVLVFDEASIKEKYIDKKFHTDSDYRLSFSEGVRLASFQGVNIPADIKAACDKYQNEALDNFADDACNVCGGSELSGNSLICEGCERVETHFHCLPIPILNASEDQSWFCLNCCKIRGLKYESQLMEDDDTKSAEKKSKKRQSESGAAGDGEMQQGVVSARKRPNNKEREKLGSVDRDDTPMARHAVMNDKTMLFDIIRPYAIPNQVHARADNNDNNSTNNESEIYGSTRAQPESIEHYYPNAARILYPQMFQNTVNKKNNNKQQLYSDGNNVSMYQQDVQNNNWYQCNPMMMMMAMMNMSTPSDFQHMLAPFYKSMPDMYQNGHENNNVHSQRMHELSQVTQAVVRHGNQQSQNSQRRQQKENEVRSHAVVEPVDEDEECFVCHETGQLQLCDFPQCPRAYHRSCVLSCYPLYTSINSTSSACTDESNSENHNSNNNDSKAWFCPRHYCVRCSTVESPRDGSEPSCPDSFPVSRLSDSLLITKPLKQCSQCPLSICEDCEPVVIEDIISTTLNNCNESTVSQETSVDSSTTPGINSNNNSNLEGESHNNLRLKSIMSVKKNLVGPRIAQCLNCRSESPLIRLAKTLEFAFMHMARSRLSVPFMRPLLPLTSENDIISNELPNSDSPKDLLDVLHKIRSLQYVNGSQLVDDLRNMQLMVQDKINSSLRTVSLESSETILQSFATLIDSTELILKGRRTMLTELEREIVEFVDKNHLKNNRNNSNNNQHLIDHSRYSSSVHGLTKMFRRECMKTQLYLSRSQRLAHENSSNVEMTDNTKSDYMNITQPEQPRSLLEWAEYLACLEKSDNNSSMETNSLFKNNRDELKEAIQDLTSTEGFGQQSRMDVMEVDNDNEDESPLSIDNDRDDDFCIASELLSLRGNLRGEGSSLMELEDLDRHCSWDKAMRKWNRKGSGNNKSKDANISWDLSNLREDELDITFTHLKEMTTKTLALQSKIQKMIRKREMQVSDLNAYTISVGEAHIIKELQLSNANLKWRLGQKDRVIEAKDVVIANLQSKLESAEKEIQRLSA